MIEAFIAIMRDLKNNKISHQQFKTLFLKLHSSMAKKGRLSVESEKLHQELFTDLYLGNITLQEYEQKYLQLIPEAKEPHHIIPFGQEAQIIDKLFYVVESYCGIPELFDPKTDMNEEQLLAAVEDALIKLDNLSENKN